MNRLKTRPRSGVAAVELAVTLPLLTLITLGTIEATRMIFLRQALLVAAHEGARIALVRSTNIGNVTAASNQVLTDRRIVGGTVTVTPSDFDTQPYGTFIRVQVSAPCSGNSAFAPWFYAGRTLVGQVEMMKEND